MASEFCNYGISITYFQYILMFKSIIHAFSLQKSAVLKNYPCLEKYTLLDKHISGGIQNPNADPLALGSHASGTKLALKAR